MKSPKLPRRDGDCLVLTEGATLPPRCPLCNSADVGPPLNVRFAVQRKGGLIGGGVSAGIDRVKGWNYTGPVEVKVPFCGRHRARRTYALMGGLALALVGGVVSVLLVRADYKGPPTVIAFAAAAIGLIVALATFSGVLNLWFKPRRFDDRKVWVSGLSPEYLDALPDHAEQ